MIISMKKNVSLIFLFCLFGGIIHAQRNTKAIKGVTGTAFLTEHKTLYQAQTEALANAKQKAMVEAGLIENVQYVQLMLTEDTETSFEQSFSEVILNEMRGGISDYEMVGDYKNSIDEFGNIQVSVTINAQVVRYKTDVDPGFMAKISNLKSVYSGGETLQFAVKNSKDAYLKVFLLESDQSGSIIYPLNSVHKDTLLHAGKIYQAPFSEFIDYYLDANESKEVYHLVVVLTKENVPYILAEEDEGSYNTLTTVKDILSWIYKIEPSQRWVGYYNFNVRGKF